MKQLIPAVTLLLVGCQSAPPPEIQAMLADGERIKAEQNAATDANGWTVLCVEDHHKAERTCRAGTFGTGSAGGGIPFQVYYVNKSGPFIMAGHHNFPGRDATIRVDSGTITPASRPAAVVQALKGGTTAYVVYHVWPEGERRMTVDVSGFSAAHNRLLSLL